MDFVSGAPLSASGTWAGGWVEGCAWLSSGLKSSSQSCEIALLSFGRGGDVTEDDVPGPEAA